MVPPVPKLLADQVLLIVVACIVPLNKSISPLKVLAPETFHVPVSFLISRMVLAPLLVSNPENSFPPVPEPPSVKSAPLAVVLLITLPLQTKAPEPEFFRALNPVPPSTSERVVLLELLAVNETVAEPPNVSWVPVPKELLPLSATLVTASVPPPIVTFPLKVLAPERVSVFAAFW